ncbi:hypothetical protein [Flavobacterium granuli]|uniref:Uncharacterized protein n=1 Tax=Flavobacterium granuli TaxID=280093 RepID=A0A1M5IVP6_9FLAO|nr:hypothetical protein [Flavobacterium granuli]PRZ28120.1 hypothetical protein BC624_101407 [Flavobacterium granuli]SHG32109.1 hypothetical protein SAMN05443373_101407 [Flavobacterium granuli]
MNANENKQIDDFAKKVIKKATLESPSFDFTAQIMTQLNELKQSEATIYKPLISKTAWFVIFIGFVILVGYAIIGAQPQPPSYFDFSNLNVLLEHKITASLFQFTFSKIVLYALTLLSVMVLVQVSFLKAYFNKRYEH